MADEPKVNLNISGIPASWISEIDQIDDIRSRAVVILIGEALDARKRKSEIETKKGA